MFQELSLDEIGVNFGTDKASVCKELLPCDYLRHYEIFLKNKKVSFVFEFDFIYMVIIPFLL